MKLLKKITIISTGLLMVAGNAVKANAEKYTYTVEFDEGSGYGIITGDISGTYDYNTPISLATVRCDTPADSKYYFKGWHVSGVEGTNGYDPTVTKDIVYVATYGIADNLVNYTVTYSDADGNALAPSQTFYGNVGDKPVLPYLYIEGYEPQAYNLTKTLSDNAADNVFPFVYTPIAAVPGGEGGTTYTYVDVDGGVTVITVPGGGGGGGAAPAGGGGGAPAGGGGAGPAPAVIPDNTPPAAGPDQIIDIDEDQTPAGEFSPAPTSEASASPETIPEPGTPGGGMSNAWKIALATGGGIGLLLLLLLLLRRKDNLS